MDVNVAETLETAAAAARACTLCADLPLGPRPIFQVSVTARVLIASQAPGTKAHVSGTPFMDPSGVRLRAWLGMDEALFYDAARIAILPMAFCYPGRLPQGGDEPPRPVCAPLWQPRILPLLTGLRLILLVGGYSQDFHLSPIHGRGAMTERVRDHARYLPRFFPLPHPSWRTVGWEMRNPWFGAEVLPALRRAVAEALA
jgi:uracil-DNA glycosylase